MPIKKNIIINKRSQFLKELEKEKKKPIPFSANRNVDITYKNLTILNLEQLSMEKEIELRNHKNIREKIKSKITDIKRQDELLEKELAKLNITKSKLNLKEEVNKIVAEAKSKRLHSLDVITKLEIAEIQSKIIQLLFKRFNINNEIVHTYLRIIEIIQLKGKAYANGNALKTNLFFNVALKEVERIILSSKNEVELKSNFIQIINAIQKL